MTLIGTDGAYLFGLQLYTQDTSSQSIQTSNINQCQTIIDNIGANIKGLTLTQIINYISSDTDALKILDGLAGYPYANIELLQRLIAPQSFNYIMNSLVRAMSSNIKYSNIQNIMQPQQATKQSDFNLRECDFVSFKVQEYIGMVLPMYELSFIIHDKTLLKNFNPSSRFILSFGETENDLTKFNASIYRTSPVDNGDTVVINISGCLDVMPLITKETQISYFGTSLDVLNKMASEYNLKVDTNISKTNDEMTWKSSNTRPLDYMIKVWKHAYIDESSQICTAIDINNNLIFTNLAESQNNKTVQAQNKLLFTDNPFYANFGSIRNQKYVYDVKTGKVLMKKLTDLNNKTSVTSNNTKLSGLRIGSYGVLSPEMHEHWYDAELLNQSKLYGALTKTAWLNAEASWKSYKVTDMITINSGATEDNGNYIICGKLFNIINRKANTYIQLAREGYTALAGVSI